jgi:hypothetical protein
VITSPLTTERESTASFVGHYIKRDRVTLPQRVNADVLAGIIRVTNPSERGSRTESDPSVIAIRRDALEAMPEVLSATVVLDALAAQ